VSIVARLAVSPDTVVCHMYMPHLTVTPLLFTWSALMWVGVMLAVDVSCCTANVLTCPNLRAGQQTSHVVTCQNSLVPATDG
jgi:hypothetical protein